MRAVVAGCVLSCGRSGRVVPGYGHAVLRKPDPRFDALRDFGNRNKEVSQDPVFKLVDSLFRSSLAVLGPLIPHRGRAWRPD